MRSQPARLRAFLVQGALRLVGAACAIVALCAPPVSAGDWPTAALGELAAWDAAYDGAAKTRFIPFQLIVPGMPWNGSRKIDAPAKVDFFDRDHVHWTGPVADTDVLTGQPIVAYGRSRANKREGTVMQRFAVRTEQDGIGRVYDSRFGVIRCSGEIKFPVGEWKEGETRKNEYACVGESGKQTRRFNILTMEKIDFSCHGVPHCMQFTWTHHIEGRASPADDRRYIFAPGLSEVGHDRLK